jgi:hypothetical protein
MRPAEIDQFATRRLTPQQFLCAGGGLDIAH